VQLTGRLPAGVVAAVGDVDDDQPKLTAVRAREIVGVVTREILDLAVVPRTAPRRGDHAIDDARTAALDSHTPARPVDRQAGSLEVSLVPVTDQRLQWTPHVPADELVERGKSRGAL